MTNASESSAKICIDPSWNSLLKAGGISSILAGLCLILSQVFLADLNSLFSGFFASSIMSNSVITVPQKLAFVESHSNLYYGWYISGDALAALFGLPALLALLIVLSRVDKGFALIGSALGFASIGIILSNVSNQFYLINEAFVFDSGCTVCASQAITGATATYSAYTAEMFASLILTVAEIILSIVILKGMIFNRSLGFLGLGSALVGLVIAFFNSNYYISFLPTLVLAAWLLAVGYSLVRLPPARTIKSSPLTDVSQ